MVYLKLLSYKDVVDLLVYSSNISYNNNNKNNTAEYNNRDDMLDAIDMKDVKSKRGLKFTL